jgi:hypothetical protein
LSCSGPDIALPTSSSRTASEPPYWTNEASGYESPMNLVQISIHPSA